MNSIKGAWNCSGPQLGRSSDQNPRHEHRSIDPPPINRHRNVTLRAPDCARTRTVLLVASPLRALRLLPSLYRRRLSEAGVQAQVTHPESRRLVRDNLLLSLIGTAAVQLVAEGYFRHSSHNCGTTVGSSKTHYSRCAYLELQG